MGIIWKLKIGGGFLVGNTDEKNTFSGASNAYVYPDSRTSIIGHFDNETVLEGRLYELSDVRFENEFPTPVFKKFNFHENNLSKQENEIYMYDPANQTNIGKNVLQRDPYEELYLYVAESRIKGAGRGVFLKKNVSKGDVVGFYNGVRLTGLESKLKQDDRQSPYRMDNEWAEPEQILNIPPNYR